MIIEESYPATVVNNDDPEKRGRIKVACTGLLGSEDVALPFWVEPDYEWGWFIVPDVGEIVNVKVVTNSDDDEQPEQISISNLNARWCGRHWGGLETDIARPVPEEFTSKNYAKRRGFKTPAGHVVLFDDTEGSLEVSITWNDEKNGKKSSITFDPKGQIVILDQNGNQMTFDGVDQITIKAGATLTLESELIKNGANAEEAMVLGDTFQDHYLNHVHPTAFGPSSKLTQTGGESDYLSTKNKVE